MTDANSVFVLHFMRVNQVTARARVYVCVHAKSHDDDTVNLCKRDFHTVVNLRSTAR